ncbi:UvrD-helicase domain-containing protein [Thiohalobacter sp. IOR34]|uniref:UvrD-helicase domain-containing protein n=1 Tax=Thiohalobacter sp. IOR34 TaxID=3057176 RepID=UPI0025B15169|nr:UvrD-helicase domain-containing protein [Thiohalobacter sp. IOR34]WJW74753.1 UvrD-helicase domain-containing protein [Thiohalobacter sp. IOR34]
MSDPLIATDPARNATVHASAGTGKTWLLVTRMLRLLLAGSRPGGILAVTFTRKAATEMLQRLNERLAELAAADDSHLDALLAQIGLQADPGLRERARGLYEQHLFCDQPLRATTFHAFCQSLLQRFPLEAGVPPDFELADNESELREAAWEALYAEASADPEGTTARALETLFDACRGLHNSRQALEALLAQRIDWWAWCGDKQDPPAWASQALANQLGIDPGQDPLAAFFTPPRLNTLREFSSLLGRHPIQSHLQQIEALESALQLDVPGEQRLAALRQALLTKDGRPRSRKASKTLIAKLGESGTERLLELHEQLCAALLELLDLRARLDHWRLSRAWYRAGQQLLSHYQRIKRERRLLDFADLEWNAYRLLNRSGHAHWIQYKLDARVDHLLVDEFQDTNPTQWRLLLPLLEELAAGSDAGRPRSVFLVGDAKQSIYRFRRADARLLDTASGWLEGHLQALRVDLDRSRRSSAAIVDCVNRVFSRPPLAELIPDFPHHDTFLGDLWGRVELLPLIEAEATPPAASGLRDPLQRPRQRAQDDRHYREGRLIAERLRALVEAETLIEVDGRARPLRYGDCLLLLRHRTHAGDYERALRDAGIPYLGTARGTLLENLEIRDLVALLNTLTTPHDDLALAQVLRSPLFALTDADLITLASRSGTDWMQRLEALARDAEAQPALTRAARLLGEWRQLVGRLPVHDLLDRIFHQGEVMARYRAATPEMMRPGVLANLGRFLELALEVDSGRYPSLPRFLARLEGLRRQGGEAPDDAPPAGGAGDRVCLLTVHGAKGLEAPLVCLADSASSLRGDRAWEVLVDWPSEAERPRRFLLNPGREGQFRLLDEQLAARWQAEQREDANLLYVALTRPRQLLIVSGCVPSRSDALGWYGLIRDGLEAGETLATGESWVLESGRRPAAAGPVDGRPAVATEIDPRLARPLGPAAAAARLAPSRPEPEATTVARDPDAVKRGIAIHRMLELLSAPGPRPAGAVRARLARETGRLPSDPQLVAWLAEAEALLGDPALAALFDPSRYRRAWKEVPLQYQAGERQVQGVLDRLVENDDGLLLIDYKTHPLDATAARVVARQYRQQLQLYQDGVARLWPDRPLRSVLLFTHCRTLIPLETL